MQTSNIGGIGDFGKLALLRHVMKGRRLGVCWYPAGETSDKSDGKSNFEYLSRPEEFRHLAPEVFDALREIAGRFSAVGDSLTALQMSGIMGDTMFLRNEVPTRASLRRAWVEGLVSSVRDANLVFLDPNNGVQGKRLTCRHVALAEIAALRRPDRSLIIGHRHSGRRAEARFLLGQMRSLGCDPVEIIRLRLVTSRFYVICDHDALMTDLIAGFVRKWGNWAKAYCIEPLRSTATRCDSTPAW